MPADKVERQTVKYSLFSRIYLESLLFVFSGMFICITIGSCIIGLVTAIVLALLAIAFYFIGKKHHEFRLINPFLNALSVGFVIGIFMLFRAIKPEVIKCAATAIIFIIMVLITNIILDHVHLKKTVIVVSITGGISLCILSYIFRNSDKSFCFLLFFVMIYYAVLMLGEFYYTLTKKDFWFCLSLFYGLAFELIFFIVLAVLTEGDGLEDVFLTDIGGETRDKNKKIYRRNKGVL